ncbi:indole-3-glycerol phosphate synthase TrpC [Ornithinibacillus sp. L9]|uniref:Indole-3-glycerol phosphate synthase n=1 Tax=Ornithinibacillus caprae TaxID=2678566 RepID=A0A6N8FI51_9BACI|nr:indole-3-glycerol phosphate synthase TrpC [Ornithinibacillus caprae]MUK87934.1 indole-3-glycerol phosphate synthase TrpC [Ornithinibacillus caprae]
MTILDDILKEKKKEVARLNAEGVLFERRYHKPRSLYDTFVKNKHLHVIAEIKRASPSKGDIQTEVNPVEQAKKYVEAGAGAISVLTDTPFFKGSMNDLQAVREVVDVPLLCKDFIIDPIQIDRAKECGADVILLIVAALPKHKLVELYFYAKYQELDVLLEVHNEEELQVALEMEAGIIGINNRDLKTFDVSLAVTERLAKRINTEEVLVISESGIVTGNDASRALRAGVKGILVGETLMRAENIQTKMNEFMVPWEGEKA